MNREKRKWYVFGAVVSLVLILGGGIFEKERMILVGIGMVLYFLLMRSLE